MPDTGGGHDIGTVIASAQLRPALEWEQVHV